MTLYQKVKVLKYIMWTVRKDHAVYTGTVRHIKVGKECSGTVSSRPTGLKAENLRPIWPRAGMGSWWGQRPPTIYGVREYCKRYLEFSFPSTFVPGSEKSTGRTFVPWNIRSVELWLRWNVCSSRSNVPRTLIINVTVLAIISCTSWFFSSWSAGIVALVQRC